MGGESFWTEELLRKTKSENALARSRFSRLYLARATTPTPRAKEANVQIAGYLWMQLCVLDVVLGLVLGSMLGSKLIGNIGHF